jgi:hypothetical protein
MLCFIFTYHSWNTGGNLTFDMPSHLKNTWCLLCPQLGIILLWKTASVLTISFQVLSHGSRIITLKPKGQTSVKHCVKSQEAEAEKFFLLHLNINCRSNSDLDWQWPSNLKWIAFLLTSKMSYWVLHVALIFSCPVLFLVFVPSKCAFWPSDYKFLYLG